jgi:hypothetical protein
MTDNTINYRIQNGTSTNACSFGSATPTITLNQFQHIVQVYDNGTSYIYKDGILVEQAACSALIGDNTSNMLIGMPTFTFSNSKGFTGVIDDIRIYNKSLSPCDVDSLFNMPNSIATGILSSIKESESFTMYPNPANEIITILFNSNESKSINIELFDLLGNNVQKTSLISLFGDNKVEIKLTGINNGVYLLKLGNSIKKLQINK